MGNDGERMNKLRKDMDGLWLQLCAVDPYFQDWPSWGQSFRYNVMEMCISNYYPDLWQRWLAEDENFRNDLKPTLYTNELPQKY